MYFIYCIRCFGINICISFNHFGKFTHGLIDQIILCAHSIAR